jgi:hypothetical protein
MAERSSIVPHVTSPPVVANPAALRASTVMVLGRVDLKDAILPVCIPIFSTDRRIREAKWVELYDATFTELEKEIERRTAALKTTLELQSLERTRERLAPYMANKPDEPIGPVLARLVDQP